MAETKEQKAHRYLREGRLTVERVGVDGRFRITATCRGSDGDYQLGYDAQERQWRCTCEANAKFNRRCSHLLALQLVTRRPTNLERSGRG